MCNCGHHLSYHAWNRHGSTVAHIGTWLKRRIATHAEDTCNANVFVWTLECLLTIILGVYFITPVIVLANSMMQILRHRIAEGDERSRQKDFDEPMSELNLYSKHIQ